LSFYDPLITDLEKKKPSDSLNGTVCLINRGYLAPVFLMQQKAGSKHKMETQIKQWNN
jgi:hypothetical protein